MNRLFRAAQLVGVNSVPVAGILFSGWDNGTALALYFCENLVMIVLVSLRITLHRHLTNKRGHFVEQRTSTNGGRSWKKSIAKYGSTFLLTAVVFSAAEAVFLGAFMAGESWNIDRTALENGLAFTTAFLLLGFFIDLATMRQKSFGWIRAISEGTLGRVMMIFLTMIIAFVVIASLKLPRSVFVVFAVLKLWSDIAVQLPTYDPDEAPGWMVRLLGRGFADYFRKEKQDRLAAEREDEEPFDGRPSRSRQLGADVATQR